MPDEAIIDLLREIRDLQKQHVENYQDALKNQRAAIKLQRRAMLFIPFLVLILAGFLVFFYYLSR
jgi:ABC-type lipoprotein release transport system permease subunit